MKQTLFTKDFTLVVIGQIISLLGNAVIRFALPLYLLNLTGSPALYGTVTACAFLPAILLSPVGGIIADRVNKRTVMVALDFSTAAVLLIFALLMQRINLIFLLTVTLMLLYGIAGAYQPAVQASIPALVHPDCFMAANSIINTVSSFASLAGPVLGGILYSSHGLTPILVICTLCFFLSAILELFIHMPPQKQTQTDSILALAKDDLAKSIRFLCSEKPIIGKVLLIICAINLFLSSMLLVALPCLITEVFDFEASFANRLYGFAEGALAVGGLAGGICAGIFSKKLRFSRASHLIAACALCVFPISAALILHPSPMVVYLILTAGCFFIMVCSTIFTVQMLSFLQAQTPPELMGKVIAVALTVAMCAQPLGNMLYGTLFELCRGQEALVLMFSGTASLLTALAAERVFRQFSFT